jgi:tetratricopeptide (TPR) repeat protein
MYRFYTCILIVILITCTACDQQPDQPEKQIGKQDSTANDLDAINARILKDPQNLDLYIERANYFSAKRKFSDAIIDVNRVLAIDSSKAEYLLTAADVFFFSGQTKSSNDLLSRLIRLHPEHIDGLLRMAQMKHYLRKYKEELDLLDRVLRIDVNNAQAYFMKGMVFKEMGDTAKAISSMQTAVEQSPDYYNAYIQLGLIFAAQKNPLAVEYYANALKVQPQSQEALYNLGLFHQNTDDYNKALEVYSTLLQLNPNHFDAHFNLGFLHVVKLNEVDKGMDYFTLCTQDNPKEPRGYYGLGFCYKRKGDIGNAEAMFKQALTVAPNYQNAIIELNKLREGL